MIDDKPRISSVYERSVAYLKRVETEEIIVSMIILLSIIGVAITDYAPASSRAYWIFMVAVLCISAIVIEKTLVDKKGVGLANLLATQAIHWGATLIAILVSFAFVKTGRMTYEGSGLVILLILALSTFLDGNHVGWRFYLAGFFLGLTAVLTAYLEEFMWILVVVGIGGVVLSIYLERYLTVKGNESHETPAKENL